MYLPMEYSALQIDTHTIDIGRTEDKADKLRKRIFY